MNDADRLLDALCDCDPDERAVLMGLLADEALDRADEALAEGWRYLAAKKRWPDVDGKGMGHFDDCRCAWWVRYGDEGKDPFDLPRGTKIDDQLDRKTYPHHRAYSTLQECLLKAAHAVGALLAARKAKSKGKLGLR
jgi:hypothetical protein